MADDRKKEELRTHRDATIETTAERNVAADIADQTIRRPDVARMPRSTAAVQKDAAMEQRTTGRGYATVEGYAARGSAIGFYTLLGIIALGLLVFTLVSLNHSSAPQESTVVNRMVPNVPSSALTPLVETSPSRNIHDTAPSDPAPTWSEPASSPAPIADAPPSALSSPAPSSAPSDIPAPPTSPTDTETTTAAAPDSTPPATDGTTASGTTTSPPPSDPEHQAGNAPIGSIPADTSDTAAATPAPTTITNNGQARL